MKLPRAPFSYNKATRCYSAEVSDLQLKAGWPMPREIELQMEGGYTLTFQFFDTDKDEEGEVQGWLYKNNSGCSLLLIND
jgi:hypothetical protein